MIDVMKQNYRSQREALRQRLKQQNIHKQSFLKVTALNQEKWKSFVTEQMGFDWNTDREIVNALTERLRLCLKIHGNLLDDRMDDEWKWAEILFAERMQAQNPGDDQKDADPQVKRLGKW